MQRTTVTVLAAAAGALAMAWIGPLRAQDREVPPVRRQASCACACAEALSKLRPPAEARFRSVGAPPGVVAVLDTQTGAVYRTGEDGAVETLDLVRGVRRVRTLEEEDERGGKVIRSGR